MNSSAWLQYYQQNCLNRPEPQWRLPPPEDSHALRALARSLAHFQLGESGDGTNLLRHAHRTHADDPAYCEALAFYVQAEQSHALLLEKLVARYRGRPVTSHWTHSLFRCVRRALGIGFEIQVLVIAELIGTGYYRLLGRLGSDPVLREVCDLLLRDEAQHVAFHAERLATDQAAWLPIERALWVVQFQMLFLAAVQVAWMDHGAALRALGAQRWEFLHEARSECIHFLASFAAAGACSRAADEPSIPAVLKAKPSTR
jgi:hypothetical protein